jgi:hypothetical protein
MKIRTKRSMESRKDMGRGVKLKSVKERGNG